MVAPSRGSAAQFALWLDGNTTPGGGGNGIPFSLTAAFSASSFTLITNAQLDTPGFLSGFDAVIISPFGFGPGTALSTASVTNMTIAAATHHGYIGELNGAIMAFTSNDSGFLPAIGLLPGTSTGVKAVDQDPAMPPVGFIYEEGPIGTGHPIDQGITFPFTTNESTLFLGFVTSFDKTNVVDQYGDNGLDSLAGVPAIVANKAVIDGVAPPPTVPEPASLVLFGFGVAGVAAWKHRRRRDRRDS
jgi:hypothetical protein